jgi:hypothetical protein
MATTEALKNFKLIHPNIGLGGVRAELAVNDLAWKISTQRQEVFHVQRETEAIYLRQGIAEPGRRSTDCHGAMDSIGAKYFPRTMNWLRATAAVLGGELARASIVRLKPRGQVYRHIDDGQYYVNRRRFHLVIHSAGGSPLGCGDENVVMHEGELWEFDNKLPHDAQNPSDEPRVHLIFDLLPYELGGVRPDADSSGTDAASA